MKKQYFDVSNIWLDDTGIVEIPDGDLKKISDAMTAGGRDEWLINPIQCTLNDFGCGDTNGLFCIGGGTNNPSCSNEANCGNGSNTLSCTNSIGCNTTSNNDFCANGASCLTTQNDKCSNAFASGCSGSQNGANCP